MMFAKSPIGYRSVAAFKVRCFPEFENGLLPINESGPGNDIAFVS